MTNAEFREWFKVHRAAFPNVQSWLEKFPDIETDAQPSRAQVMAQWIDTLRDQKLEHCQQATAIFSRGDQPPPEYASDHARAVRKLAREIAARDFKLSPVMKQDAYSQRRYKCRKCFDDGRLICWHPIAMQAAKEKKFPHPLAMLLCAINCDCGTGRCKASFLPTYNEKQWVIVTGETERDRLALIAWADGAEQRMAWNPDEHQYPGGDLGDRTWFQTPE